MCVHLSADIYGGDAHVSVLGFDSDARADEFCCDDDARLIDILLPRSTHVYLQFNSHSELRLNLRLYILCRCQVGGSRPDPGGGAPSTTSAVGTQRLYEQRANPVYVVLITRMLVHAASSAETRDSLIMTWQVSANAHCVLKLLSEECGYR